MIHWPRKTCRGGNSWKKPQSPGYWDITFFNAKGGVRHEVPGDGFCYESPSLREGKPKLRERIKRERKSSVLDVAEYRFFSFFFFLPLIFLARTRRYILYSHFKVWSTWDNISLLRKAERDMRGCLVTVLELKLVFKFHILLLSKRSSGLSAGTLHYEVWRRKGISKKTSLAH